MKSKLLLALALPLCMSYITLSSWQYLVRSGTLDLQLNGCTLGQLYSCSQSTFIYQVDTALTIYPQNSIYLASNALSCQLDPQFSTEDPYYFFTYKYTPGSSSFTVLTYFTTEISLPRLFLTYLAVQKSYPLYFRAFQYTLNMSLPSGIIDSLAILNQTKPLTSSSFQYMYAVSGLTFNSNDSSVIGSFSMNATLDPASLQLTYSFDVNSVGFISAVRINVAVFSTSAIYEELIFTFDIAVLPLQTSDKALIDTQIDMLPIMVGIGSLSVNKLQPLEYNFQLAGELKDKQWVYSITGSTAVPGFQTSVAPVFATSLNVLAVGKLGCQPYVEEIAGATPVDPCKLFQNWQNNTLVWSGSCTVSKTEHVCDVVSCGNGIVQEGQQCDLGLENSAPKSGCTNNCTVLPGFTCYQITADVSWCAGSCGDGIVADSEQCDLGTDNGDAMRGCNSNCKPYPGFQCITNKDFKSECQSICGDGVTLGEEQCDLGDDNGNITTGCGNNCTAFVGFNCIVVGGISECSALCGDGITAGDEQCDQGSLNGKPQQACSYNCKILPGFGCETSINYAFGGCKSECGDGIVAGLQKCDLKKKNGEANTGCTANCSIAAGYSCPQPNISCTTTCGDGLTAGNQTCDLNLSFNGNPEYGCFRNCTPMPGFKCRTAANLITTCFTICGDILVAGRQSCDLGQNNGQLNSPCSAKCKVQKGFACDINETTLIADCFSICGDGYTVGNESCDSGTDKTKLGCKNCSPEIGYNCTVNNYISVCVSTCGDGVKSAIEDCDTGYQLESDQKAKYYGCSKECLILAGFRCRNLANYSSECQSICGDGIVAGYESCDLPNKNGEADSGCTANCTIQPGYNCTLANNSYICSTLCGDGLAAGAQQCDLATNNGNPRYGCSSTCTVFTGFNCTTNLTTLLSTCSSICGDALVAGLQECDLGANNGQQAHGCSNSCKIIPGYNCTADSQQNSTCESKCGDTIVAGYQECDDGIKNGAKGDGCSSNCTIEDGYVCQISGTISNCSPVCGDGKLVAGEQCDQGANNGKPSNPCSDSCLIQPGYACTYEPFACSTTCGDGILAGSQQCDDGSMNGPNNTCLSNCTLNRNNTICLQVDPNQPCSPLILGSPLNLTSYTKSTDSNSIEIKLASDQPLATRRLLVAVDSNTVYQLPKEITLNFPYQSATVRLPDPYTLVIKVLYAASLNNQTDLSVTLARFQTKLPAVPDNNLALKYYTSEDYSIAFAFSKVVPILAYLVLGLALLMLGFTSKILGLEMIFLFQFAHGCLIMLRKLQVGLYPFKDLWIFSGYMYPVQDNSRVDPRVATLGYKANFIANFNFGLIIFLLPLTTALVLVAYKKARKARSHRLDRVISSLGEDWQLTAMLFALQPLLFAFVINLTYSPLKAVGIAIGLVLIALFGYYVYLYYQKEGDLVTHKQRFSQFKRGFRYGHQNFYVWTMAYKGLLSLAMITASQSIVSQSVMLVLICSWITILFVKRPYVSHLELAPFVNSFIMLILILFFLYTRSAADLPEINFATYIPMAVLILLGCTFLFDFAFAVVYMRRARLIVQQLAKDKEERKGIEYSLHPTLQVFKEANEKTLDNLHSSSGNENPTEIISVIMDKQDKDVQPSTQFKKDNMPPFQQISSIRKISEKSQNYVSDFQLKIQNTSSPNYSLHLQSHDGKDIAQSPRRGLPPIQQEPPISSIRYQ